MSLRPRYRSWLLRQLLAAEEDLAPPPLLLLQGTVPRRLLLERQRP